MEPRLELIDHSGDLGLRAVSGTAADVLVLLTIGMERLRLEEGAIRCTMEREIAVTAADPAELLVGWLAEVLAAADAAGEIYGEAVVEELELPDGDTDRPCRVRGVVRGEPVDPARHHLGREIKAVTYHLAELRREEEHWIGQVVFDL